MCPGIHLQCLGQKIGACPNQGKEIKRKIEMGWNAFGRQHKVMRNSIPLSLKRKVYKSV